MTPVLEAVNLSKAFGALEAVRQVSFSLDAGEMLALIGPNGAGKSTCFNLLMGQLKPDGGQVRLSGEDITGLAPRRIWRRGVGRTFQITQTYPSMSVLENVQMALISHHRRSFSLKGIARRLYRNDALGLLDSVGMAAQSDRAAAVLAYGDVKRLELAIALANSPRLLLMDEPTAGMAPGERAQLMALISSIVARDGISVLFTEHDMDMVFGHADRVLVMNRGELIASGTVAEVRANQQVREVYLGGTAAAGRGGRPRRKVGGKDSA